MHPLEKDMDESAHGKRPGPPPRRRSSLDNSSLAAAETFKQILQDAEDFKTILAPRRRLSLNAGQTITPTFLAEMNKTRRTTDLDLEGHSSTHGPSSSSSPRKVSDNSDSSSFADTSPSAPMKYYRYQNDDSDDSSESSLESGDSFCDASVQEPANREYLRKDLGASCYWNSGNDFFVDTDGGMHDMKSMAHVDMILEEGNDSD